jgi:hypothetical protein
MGCYNERAGDEGEHIGGEPAQDPQRSQAHQPQGVCCPRCAPPAWVTLRFSWALRISTCRRAEANGGTRGSDGGTRG